VVLAGCVTGGDASPIDATGEEALVISVADGDSLEVRSEAGAETVRLAGINAPDRGECHADAARDNLAVLVEKTVRLVIVGSDQFGRTLAHVFHDEAHLNLDMVAAGLAIASNPEDDPHGEAILFAEDRAYATGVGLWGSTACGSSRVPPTVEIDESGSTVDPGGPDDRDLSDELIVLVNRGSESVDLSDWVLRDESSRHRYTFDDGTALGPGASVVITSADPGWDPGDSPVWNNDGDMALLQDASGTVVARWRY